MAGVMRPCLTVSCTCGSRTTNVRRPPAPRSRLFRSLAGNRMLRVEDILDRDVGLAGAAHSSTRCDDKRAARSHQRGRELRCAPVLLANRDEFLKSWSNAQWITPSDLAAPLRKLSKSWRSTRCGLGASRDGHWAPASDRVSPITWRPFLMSPGTMADPMKPVQPR